MTPLARRSTARKLWQKTSSCWNAQANAPLSEECKFQAKKVICRYLDKFIEVEKARIEAVESV